MEIQYEKLLKQLIHLREISSKSEYLFDSLLIWLF